jgi:kynureninase
VPALAASGVVTDFREPDIVRVGMSPLTTRFVDVHDGVASLARLVGAAQGAGVDADRMTVSTAAAEPT